MKTSFVRTNKQTRETPKNMTINYLRYGAGTDEKRFVGWRLAVVFWGLLHAGLPWLISGCRSPSDGNIIVSEFVSPIPATRGVQDDWKQFLVGPPISIWDSPDEDVDIKVEYLDIKSGEWVVGIPEKLPNATSADDPHESVVTPANDSTGDGAPNPAGEPEADPPAHDSSGGN